MLMSAHKNEATSTRRHKQKTLKKAMHCVGVGLHSGQKVSMTLKPAPVNNGIVFHRTDIAGQNAYIKADWEHTTDTMLCTCVGTKTGINVATIEHLMAALNAYEIDNLEIDITAGEVPAMDGSAAPFAFLIECAGVTEQDASRKAIRILKEISLEDGDKKAALAPAEEGLTLSFEIDFDTDTIGHQTYTTALTQKGFKKDVARARTFGFLHEVEQLRAAGFARGGSLENAVVINEDKVLNEGGLRFKDECVRHKILDAAGDLYLAGMPIIGEFYGARSGHALTAKLLSTLFADETAYEIVDMNEDLLRETPVSSWEAPLSATA